MTAGGFHPGFCSPTKSLQVALIAVRNTPHPSATRDLETEAPARAREVTCEEVT